MALSRARASALSLCNPPVYPRPYHSPAASAPTPRHAPRCAPHSHSSRLAHSVDLRSIFTTPNILGCGRPKRVRAWSMRRLGSPGHTRASHRVCICPRHSARPMHTPHVLLQLAGGHPGTAARVLKGWCDTHSRGARLLCTRASGRVAQSLHRHCAATPGIAAQQMRPSSLTHIPARPVTHR